jgi:hypothetical protein
MFTAIVRITGAGRLDDFRERLRWLMVRDEDAEEYSEHHAEGVLEYRFAPRKGIPFPAFTAASADFPELQVEAEWDHHGVRGHALIENGRLVKQTPGLGTPMLLEIALEADGTLKLALACARREGALVGYASTSERHTYFRYRDGRLELVGPDDPDEALEEVAFAFVEEWIWYDEEEAVLERARYANYGYPVHGANLRAQKLKLMRDQELRFFSSLDAQAIEAREALVAKWV